MNTDKQCLITEIEEMQIRHDELVEELGFKDNEIFMFQKKNEELEIRIEELEMQLRNKINHPGINL